MRPVPFMLLGVSCKYTIGIASTILERQRVPAVEVYSIIDYPY